MKKFLPSLLFCIGLLFLSHSAEARSSKNMTIGLLAMGNIQLIDTQPEFDPGPGGGVYFDYRFNQRFSIQIDVWATNHSGNNTFEGDSFELLGIPTFTIKLYFMDDEASRWDPYAGLGVGAFATTEGSVANGTQGVGLGAQIEVGVDYYLTDIFSVGFAGAFRSAGIINSLDQNRATALIPFTVMGRAGFHF